MNNHFNSLNNQDKYSKEKGSFKDTNRPNQQDSSIKTGDEGLIIETNTIYEIDRECVERLNRKRRR